MNHAGVGFGVIPDAGIRSGCERVVRFVGFSLRRHSESILQEEVEPFIEADSIVVSRYSPLKRLVRNTP